MRATTPNPIEAGHLVTPFATPEPGTGPPVDTFLRHDAAGAAARPEHRARVGGALARVEHVVAGVTRRLHDGWTRRRTVRELRLMGQSRLADLGIEPDGIESAVDAMIAARRNTTPTRGGRPRPRAG